MINTTLLFHWQLIRISPMDYFQTLWTNFVTKMQCYNCLFSLCLNTGWYKGKLALHVLNGRSYLWADCQTNPRFQWTGCIKPASKAYVWHGFPGSVSTRWSHYKCNQILALLNGNDPTIKIAVEIIKLINSAGHWWEVGAQDILHWGNATFFKIWCTGFT